MEVSSLIKLLIIPSNIIQYNAALAITEAIRRTSKEKLYQEPGLQSLQSRRWFRKLSLFHKIIKRKSPSYLYHLIPKPLTSYSTRNSQNLPPIKANHSFFKNTFFSIHHHRMEQIRFEYSLFSFLQTFQKTNPRINKTSA